MICLLVAMEVGLGNQFRDPTQVFLQCGMSDQILEMEKKKKSL
jgi:hypothetical protein